jgi:hypothetical protein
MLGKEHGADVSQLQNKVESVHVKFIHQGKTLTAGRRSRGGQKANGARLGATIWRIKRSTPVATGSHPLGHPSVEGRRE